MINSTTALIKVTALATIAAVPLLQGCGRESMADEAAAPYLHKVSTLEIRHQPAYQVTREFAGEVQAGQNSLLGLEMPGRLDGIYVDEGDRVAEGQLLASLDTQLLAAERDELTARRAELQARYETAQRNLDRVQSLQNERLASERERDELAGETRVLRASLERVDAALDANLIRFEKSELRAPYDASVARRLLDSGVVVDAGTPVFSLVETNSREIRAGVPDSLATRFEAGESIPVRIGEERIRGRLLPVGPVVDQATRSRAVRVRVDEELPPGSLAYVEVEVPVENRGAWLPDTAVTEGARGTWVVYAAVDEGDRQARLEARSVVIHYARDSRLYVSGALTDGDRVVTSGLHRIAPGQLVRVTRERLVADARPDY